MSQVQQTYPFRRLTVDHIVEGGSRVWWQLLPTFNEPGPYTFQLQFGRTGLPVANDWVDAGAPVVNGVLAIDDQKRLYGKTLETHYRVVLTTAVSRYVSLPTDAQGRLDEKDWCQAREIIRKETLRHTKCSHDGFIVKRLRYGRRCTRCLDPQTGEIQNSRCPECFGTGFSGGYHPPLAFQWLDTVEDSPVGERRGGDSPPGQSADITEKVRVLGFPMLDKEDVFVDTDSDIRWIVDTIDEKASMRSVPLILELTVKKAPYTDVVYRIPVLPGQPQSSRIILPSQGTGSVRVTHDYVGADALTYQTADGCGIEGATILAFTKADWDAGAHNPADAVAATSTTSDGRWVWALCLDPGEYVLSAEKVGEFGPDTMPLTVVADETVDTPVFVPPAPPEEPPPLMAVTPRLVAPPDFGVF